MDNEKAIIVIDGEIKEFDSIELAKAYLQENGITDAQFETIPSEPIIPPNIEKYAHTYEFLPNISLPIKPSGQERRRERRAKERNKKH